MIAATGINGVPAAAGRSLTPMMIMVALNGARMTQDDHPGVPLTSAELARAAAECLEAGATALHIHVRDEAQNHVLDAGRYRDALSAIRREVGDQLICQITTEAVGKYSSGQQRALVRNLRPESVSIALRELVPSANEEAEAEAFYHWCRREQIRVQHILYSKDDVACLHDLIGRGVVPPEGGTIQLVLGRYDARQRGNAMDIVSLLTALNHPDRIGWPWSVCCFGAEEATASLTAAALGGHCRIGFENNIHLASGAIAERNSDLVDQMVSALAATAAFARRPATAEEGRVLGF